MTRSTRRHGDRFHWGEKLVRWLIFALVRLFYPRIEVFGAERLPEGGVILVSNHPNGLIDPLVAMAGLGWDASFLAKSTLFGNPVGSFLMNAFEALPIFRQRDDGLRGGPRGDARQRNEETFARCRQLLLRGDSLAMFPEGTTHSGSELLPLRSGAARIGLGAEAEGGWTGQVSIVPLGLWYQAKTIFRTSVLIVVGEPFHLSSYQEMFEADPFVAAREVTREIRKGLDEVVLQAEEADVLRAIPTIASWIAPLPESGSLTDQYAWTRRLLAGYKKLKSHDPKQVEALAEDVRYYADALRALGVKRPFSDHPAALDRQRFVALYVWLVLLAPVALIGFITSYLTYRLAKPVALATTRGDHTQVSTVKILGGALFVLLGWIIEALLVGSWFGAPWGWLFFVLMPLCAYTGLRWGEQAGALGELLRRHRRILLQRDRVERLKEQRKRLALDVLETLRRVEALPEQTT